MGTTVTHDAFRSTIRFSSLDAFRTFSVLAVIWHHTAGDGWSGIAARGALGVDFFFVISGFLITTLLLREHDRNGRINLRNFYVRRTLRIFPLYYLVLFVYTALVAVRSLDSPEGRTFVDHLPSFLTYTSNWFVSLDTDQNTTFYFAWSLATEEQFYLLWPPVLVLMLLAARSWPWLAIGTIALLIGIDQIATRGDHTDGIAWTIIASVATPILLGATAAVLTNRPTTFAALAGVLGGRWTNVVVLTTTLVLLQLGAADELIAVMLTLLVVASCIREDTVLHPVLTWRPLVYVGAISYGIYLMHMLAANVVRAPLGHDFGVDVFLATIPVVVCAAALSHRYFEVPILRLKTRLEVTPPSAQGQPELSPLQGHVLVDPLQS